MAINPGWLASLASVVAGCTTLNIAGSPGSMEGRSGRLAFHMGSTIGTTLNGPAGVAGEAFVEPRFVTPMGGFGMRTGYFFRTHGGADNNELDLAGGVFTLTGAAAVRGLALHAGLGLMFQGGSGYRALIGTTLWPIQKRGFGYGVTIELDYMRGTETDTDVARGQVGLNFGLELGL